MGTTNLFVELVVIGSGAVAWLFLLVLVLFGYTWIPWSALTTWPAFLPILSFVYVIGIILDRLADWLLRPFNKVIQNKFFNNFTDYQKAKIKVYDQSDSSRVLFEYGRSRTRICRAWILNFGALTIIFPVFVLIRTPQLGLSIRIILLIFGTFLFLVLEVATIFSWKQLNIAYYAILTHTIKGKK